MVSISGCDLSVRWNQSLSSGSTLNVNTTFDTPKVTITKGTETQGDAEIGKQVSFTRSDSVQNTGNEDYEVTLQFYIPSDTVSGTVVVKEPSGNTCPYSNVCGTPIENISGNYVNVTANISAGSTTSWNLDYNISEINYTQYNTTVNLIWYGMINVTKNATTIEDVYTYINISEDLTGVNLYLYSGGTWVDKTTDADYSFNTYDLDGDGSDDFASWYIPTLDGLKQFNVSGATGIPVNYTENITITNKPVTPYKNIQWLDEITFYNYNPTSVTFSKKIYPPADASNILLNGNPIEPHWDVNGRYVLIEGTIAGNSQITYNLTYITPPTTETITYEYPDVYWTDEPGTVILNISIKNWASQTLTDVEKIVNIEYAENLYLCEGFVDNCSKRYDYLDREDIVSGSYTIEIEEMEPYEVKRYTINYEIKTVTLEMGEKRRVLVNGSTLIVIPISTVSIAPIPLRKVKTELDDVDCDRVIKIIDEFGNEYEWECGSTIIDLGAYDMAERKNLEIYMEEIIIPKSNVTGVWERIERFMNETVFDFEYPVPYMGRYLRVGHVLLAIPIATFTIILVRMGIKKRKLKTQN